MEEVGLPVRNGVLRLNPKIDVLSQQITYSLLLHVVLIINVLNVLCRVSFV
jgi:hypothetical protein